VHVAVLAAEGQVLVVLRIERALRTRLFPTCTIHGSR
jgi:hypothetical protein